MPQSLPRATEFSYYAAYSWCVPGCLFEHEYRDYSDVDVLELAEGEAPPEKVDRLVEFFTGSEPNVIHDRVPGGELPGQESRSVEDIVADYRAAKEQQLRLQALAEMITDPELANYVAGQAALLGEIVGVITEEATTAGITQGELSAIDQELAQNVADNPPEVPEQWDGGEWGVSAITAGVFIGAAQGSAAAIDGAIPFYDPFEDLGYYNGENETLQWSQTLGGVSRNLLLAAGGTWAWNVSGGGQFIFTNGASRLAGVPLPHVSFAYGNTTNGMVLAEAMGMGGGIYNLPYASLGLAEGSTYYFSVSGIPILYPGAVGAFIDSMPRAHNCASGAWRAFLHGLGRGW